MTCPAPAPLATTDNADCLTTDGRVVTIRPAQPDDAEAVSALHDRCSDETRYARFFNIHRYLSPADAQRFVTVDHCDREALVVVDHGEIVGLAGYESATDRTTAEVAFLIEDAHQHRGIGSLLLEHLIALARSRGVHQLEALVLFSNRLMLDVFAKAGFERAVTIEAGEVELTLDIDDVARARASIEAREHIADVASMLHILRPERIAFVTGPLDADAIGRALADRCSMRFDGPVHTVNPDGLPVGNASGHHSVADLPDGVDMAVITLPRSELAATLAACGARGVAGCVVTTPVTGPDEVLELRGVARAAGTRLLGPGSGGLVDRHRGLETLIDAHHGPAGPVGLACQSSSVARHLADALDAQGIGVASIVTLGAKADVSGNDLLQAWSEDPTVDVVVLQLESLGNPRRFARIARHVGRQTPVVLLRTAGLHDSLPAEDRAILDQLGIIDVPSTEEAADIAAVLAREPRPKGRRVSVVCRGRGPGLLAADRLRDEGLDVVDVRTVPIDRPLVGEVAAVASSGAADSVFVVQGPDDHFDRNSAPPDVAVVVAGTEHSSGRMARALRRATAHASWTRRPDPLVAPPDPPDRAGARTAIWSQQPSASGWIELDAVSAVLDGYGIRVARPQLVASAEDAADVAGGLGYPVVLDGRAAHDDVPLDELGSLDQLAGLWDELLFRHGPGALPMAVLAAGPRSALQVHVTGHPQLGPLLRVVPPTCHRPPVGRLLPMKDDELDDLVDEVAHASRSRLDRGALHELLLRLSGLVLDNPELAEVHLDAVDATNSPASVVGAHMRITQAPAAWDDEVRHLRRDA